jgi:hypothetical protein
MASARMKLIMQKKQEEHKKKERLEYVNKQIQTYEVKNKSDILKGCKIIPGQLLPKKKYGDMYIINNLLSDCDKFSIDEDYRLVPFGESYRDVHGELEDKYKYGLKNYDIIFTWLRYIQKYHVQENIACMPPNLFSSAQIVKLDQSMVAMISGYIYLYPSHKIKYFVHPVIQRLIKTCSKPLLLIPSTMVTYDHENKEMYTPHSILLIINYKDKLIYYSNPHGTQALRKINNIDQLKNTIKFLKHINTHYLPNFKILPITESCPTRGPQGTDELCIVWSIMITHLYMLNFKTHSLNDIITYLSNQEGVGNKAYQYNMLMKSFFSHGDYYDNMSSKWFKKAGLTDLRKNERPGRSRSPKPIGKIKHGSSKRTKNPKR